MDKNDYLKMLDTNELNRLQRCAKNKDKKEIIKWGQEFEHRLNYSYYHRYKKQYQTWVEDTLKDIDLALVYTLHFCESTKFGKKRLQSVLDDVYVAMKGFYTKEFSREEYQQVLKEDGIDILEEKKNEI